MRFRRSAEFWKTGILVIDETKTTQPHSNELPPKTSTTYTKRSRSTIPTAMPKINISPRNIASGRDRSVFRSSRVAGRRGASPPWPTSAGT